MKMRALLIVGMLLLSSSSFLKAQPDEPIDQRPMLRQHMRILGDLKLTDDQKKQLEQIRFTFGKELIDHAAKAASARLELQQLFKADNPDKVAIEKKLSEISQIQTQGRMLFVNHWFNVNKMLTPEQQKVWKKALTEHRFAGRGQMMRGGRGGFRMGPNPQMQEFREKMMQRNRMDF